MSNGYEVFQMYYMWNFWYRFTIFVVIKEIIIWILKSFGDKVHKTSNCLQKEGGESYLAPDYILYLKVNSKLK